MSYRLRVRVPVPRFEPVQADAAAEGPPAPDAAKGTRLVYFEADAGTETTIYDRARLAAGATFSGPAIVEQFDATTVVPVPWTAVVDQSMNLILTRKAQADG